MRILFLILLFISCEKPGDSNEKVNLSANEDYERISLADTYNLNGYDYTVRLLDAEESKIYKNANNVYELTRDDGIERIILRNKQWPNNIATVDSVVNWYSDDPNEISYRSRTSEIEFKEDSFILCRNEEDDSDPFEIVYVRVCDEFRSI